MIVHAVHREYWSSLFCFRYAELGGYSSLDFKVTGREACDEVVTQPTVFIKLDAVVNLYHHFCDFFNLYASQHINGSFTDDVQIVIWDTVRLQTLPDVIVWSLPCRRYREIFEIHLLRLGVPSLDIRSGNWLSLRGRG